MEVDEFFQRLRDLVYDKGLEDDYVQIRVNNKAVVGMEFDGNTGINLELEQ